MLFFISKSTQQVETIDGRNENHSLAIHEGLSDGHCSTIMTQDPCLGEPYAPK